MAPLQVEVHYNKWPYVALFAVGDLNPACVWSVDSQLMQTTAQRVARHYGRQDIWISVTPRQLKAMLRRRGY